MSKIDRTAFPAYWIDSRDLCLWRRAQEGGELERLQLPPKSFDLLRFLAGNEGRLVTHEELLEAVWPKTYVQTEILKTNVLTIRTALEDAAHKPRYIETVRGRGYRFIGRIPILSGPPPHTGAPVLQGPFVGREDLLHRLLGLFQSVLSGERKVAFVVGEPGAGKTTIIQRFLAEAREQYSVTVAQGQCVEGFSGLEPYYPVLEAVATLIDGPLGKTTLEEMLATAPSWVIQLPGKFPEENLERARVKTLGATPNRMLREGCELMDTLCARGPMILVLEDLHWADLSTLDFISALHRRPSTAPLLLIVSLRPDELPANRRPLTQIISEVTLHERGIEVDLSPLSHSAIGELLSGDQPRGAVPDWFTGFIKSRSGGNPLFIRALLDSLAQRGLIERAGRGWQVLVGVDDVGGDVPRNVAQLIDSLLLRTTPAEQSALEVASVAGMTFDAAACADGACVTAEHFELICENLAARSQFIRRRAAGSAWIEGAVAQYEFNHAVVRQVLYERQGPIRRRGLHAQIAACLEKMYRRNASEHLVAELIDHFQASEEWRKCLHYIRAALKIAARRFANREAHAILDKANEIANHLPANDRLPIDMELQEHRAAIYSADHDPRAQACYERVIDLARATDAVQVETRALLGLAYVASWTQKEQSLQILERAVAAARRVPDPLVRDTALLVAFVRKLWVGGWDRDVARESEELHAAVDRAPTEAVVSFAHIYYSMLCMVSGRYRRAHDIFSTGYAGILKQASHSTSFFLNRAVWMCRVGMPWSYLFMGELGKSQAEFDAGVEMSARNNDQTAVAALNTYRSLLHFFAKDHGTALSLAKPIAQRMLNADAVVDPSIPRILPVEGRIALIFAGLSATALGDTASGARFLTAAARCMDDTQVYLDWYWRLALTLGWVELHLRRNELPAASRSANTFIDLADATDERTWQALAWDCKARVLLLQGDTTGAQQALQPALAIAYAGDAPLSSWPVFETAVSLFTKKGESAHAAHHAALLDDIRSQLAESLPSGSRLRGSIAPPRGG